MPIIIEAGEAWKHWRRPGDGHIYHGQGSVASEAVLEPADGLEFTILNGHGKGLLGPNASLVLLRAIQPVLRDDPVVVEAVFERQIPVEDPQRDGVRFRRLPEDITNPPYSPGVIVVELTKPGAWIEVQLEQAERLKIMCS